MRWGMCCGHEKLLAAILLATVALGAACGEDDPSDSGEEATETIDGEASSTTATTDLPACADAKQLVFLSFDGFLTMGGDEFDTWSASFPDYAMEPRPGAVELASAYHDSGYELVYATSGSSDLDINGTPYDDALAQWFEAAGFPYGERARVLYDASGTTVTDELLSWSTRGGTAHTAYTNMTEDIARLRAGGMPKDRIYTLGDASGVDDTVAIPSEDLSAHLTSMGEPETICR